MTAETPEKDADAQVVEETSKVEETSTTVTPADDVDDVDEAGDEA